MTSTDHAFIRAYSEDSRPTTGVATGSPTDPPREPITETVDTGIQNIVTSQLPDADGLKLDTEAPVMPEDSAHRESTRPAEHAMSLRVDDSDRVMPPPPHFSSRDAEAGENDDAADGARQETVTVEPPVAGTAVKPANGRVLRPQWEVDRFRWPKICEQLKQATSARLQSVVDGLVAQSQRGEGVVAVTSYDRHEGRTTLALCLARLSATQNLDVALVDGDLDQPRIGQNLGVAFDSGWNGLDPKLPIGEAAVLSLDDQLVVFPAGQEASQFPEREVRIASGPLLASLSEAFDLVIVDAGPMYTAAHRWFRADCQPLVPSALIVRDVRHTVMDQVDDVCCRLVKAGVHNLAIIENFQKAKPA